MSEREKKAYSIEVIYTESEARSSEVSALCEALRGRGHRVEMHAAGGHGKLVKELTRSARGLADNVRVVAETATQKIREAIEPFVSKPGAGQEVPASGAAAEGGAGGDFASIGPAAGAEQVSGEDGEVRAVVVTSPALLNEVGMDCYRIGLMPHTALEQNWQPSGLDAMVIPHPAFRQYLEYVRWSPERIFEGGYLVTKASQPTPGLGALRSRIREAEPGALVLLVMASELMTSDLQTIMHQLSMLRIPHQVFFYHADVGHIADTLRDLAKRFSVAAKMFGKLEPFADYLGMADVAIVAGSDPNLFVLQSAGVPCVCLAKAEVSSRMSFLVHEGAAIQIQHAYQLLEALQGALGDGARLDALRLAASKVVSYASVEACASAIEAALAHADGVLADPKRKVQVEAGFEAIGNVSEPAGSVNFLTPVVSGILNAAEAVSNALSPAQPAPFLQPPMPAPSPFPKTNFPVGYDFVGAQGTPYSQTYQPSMPSLTPTGGKRSLSALQSEYTQLILMEKEVDRALDAANADVRKWELRLDLARQSQNAVLANQAQIQLDSSKTREFGLYQQKEQVEQQKALVKQSARLSHPSKTARQSTFTIEDDILSFSEEEDALEKQFKELQRLQQLQALRDRMNR